MHKHQLHYPFDFSMCSTNVLIIKNIQSDQMWSFMERPQLANTKWAFLKKNFNSLCSSNFSFTNIYSKKKTKTLLVLDSLRCPQMGYAESKASFPSDPGYHPLMQTESSPSGSKCGAPGLSSGGTRPSREEDHGAVLRTLPAPSSHTCCYDGPLPGFRHLIHYFFFPNT